MGQKWVPWGGQIGVQNRAVRGGVPPAFPIYMYVGVEIWSSHQKEHLFWTPLGWDSMGNRGPKRGVEKWAKIKKFMDFDQFSIGYSAKKG